MTANAFDADPRAKHDIAWLRGQFEGAYEKLYTLRLPDVDVEVVSWRLIAIGPSLPRHSTPALAERPRGRKATRKAHFNGAEIETPVYDRGHLARAQRIVGPAIIEERETTIIILPGWHATADDSGCIMARRE